MVEVFKTNVTQKKVAHRIVTRLNKEFMHYKANFDLGDVDRILRIVCTSSNLDVHGVIRVVSEAGFKADVLPDTPPLKATARVWHMTKSRLHSAFFRREPS